MSTPPPARRPKLLVLELWGVGDLTMATTLLRAAVQADWEVTLLAKGYARELLGATFPQIRFVEFDAPWTVFRGKYRLWRWPHGVLARLVRQLRRERFEAAVSVRADPRDHLLMWLAGARRRVGFARWRRRLFLTESVPRGETKRHKVEDWRALREALGFAPAVHDEPRLQSGTGALAERLLVDVTRPVLCLHMGARIAVRRWPAAYYRQVIEHLRERFAFHLLLIPDLDGFGAELAPLADAVAPAMALAELVQVLSRVDLLLANDSAPGHLAAACGRPVIALFGPTDPVMFRPWGEWHHVVIRDICPLRPCFDYCVYPEPYCLTKLLPESAAPEIAEHIRRLMEAGQLPASFRLHE